MENAAGSADKEMEVIRDSIDFKLNALKETWVGIWQDILSTSVVGGVVDFLTKLSQIIGSNVWVSIPTIATGFALLYKTIAPLVRLKIDSFKNLQTIAEAMKSPSTIDNTVANEANAVSEDQVAAATERANAAKAQSTIINSANTTEEIANTVAKEGKLLVNGQEISQETKQLLIKGNLITETQLQTTSIIGLTKAQVMNAVKTNALTAAEGEQIIATLGLSGATNVLTASLKSLVGFITKHPFLIFFTSIAAAIGVVLSTTKSLDERLEDAQKEFKETGDKVKSLESQLDGVKSQIQEIKKLGTLSIADESELSKLEAQKTELENIYAIEKERHNLAQQELESTVNEKYNEVFKSKYQKTRTYQKQMRNGKFVDVTVEKSKDTNRADEIRAAALEMVSAQNRLDILEKNFSEGKISQKDYDTQKNELKKQRDEAEKYALDLEKELKDSVEGLDATSETYQKYLSVATYLSDSIAKKNKDFNAMSTDSKRQFLGNNIKLNNEDAKAAYKDTIANLSDEDLAVVSQIKFDPDDTAATVIEVINKALAKVKESNSVKELDPTDLLKSSEDKSNKNVTLIDLQEEADALKGLRDELDKTGKIGSSTLKTLVEMYPEAKDALGDYLQGYITEEKLFEKLEGVYKEDELNYKRYLLSKSELDGSFYKVLVEGNEDFFNELSKAYKDDFNHFKSLAMAKETIQTKLNETLSKMGYGDYFEVVQDENKQWIVKEIAKTTEAWQFRYKQAASEEAQKAADNLNKLYNLALEIEKINLDTSWPGMSGSGADDNVEYFNWIERLIKKIQTAYSKFTNQAQDETISWTKRNETLAKSLEQINAEINAQNQAANWYYNAFNSLGLSDTEQKLIKNGTIDITGEKNEATIKRINKGIEYWDAYVEATTNAEDKAKEGREHLTEQFEFISNQYDERLGLIEQEVSLLEGEQDLLEAQGYKASKNLYSSLADAQRETNELLEQERAELVTILNQTEEGTTQWYNMKSKINEVDLAIQEGTKNIIEFGNEIRQIDWDMFDDMRDGIEKSIDEADFLYELLEHDGLTDKKGNFTESGLAAQALLAEKYAINMAQANAYAQERAELEEKLANEPTDTNLLERYQDLIEKQRDSIKATYDSKDAIKDLISDAYSELEDSISDVIDKYKDLMDTIKDAYDYENQMSEKTKELTNLEKQLAAVSGDTSEEAMAKRQQLETEIEKSRKDIEQTEYERLISDTGRLLDDLQDEYKDWMDSKLENIDKDIQGIINAITGSSDPNGIKEALEKVAGDIGYNITKATMDIWSSNNPDLFKNVADSNSNVEEYVRKIYEAYDKNKSTRDPMDSLVDMSSNTNTLATRAKLFSELGLGAYTGSTSDDEKLIKKLKTLPKYAKGTSNAKVSNGYALTQEKGLEAITLPDGSMITPMEKHSKVFTNEQTNVLRNLSADPEKFMAKLLGNAPSGNSSVMQNVSVGGVTFNVKADNPEQFAKQMKTVMATDRNAQKMLQEITLGQSLGNNSLNVKKYM